MNESELKQIWQEQKQTKPSPEELHQIAHAVLSVDDKFRRKIWWRDVREIGAALLGAVLFGLVGQTWLRWIAVGSCIFVAAYIVKSRIAVRVPVKKELNLVDRVDQMVHETETQIRLGRSVLWWYLLPCAIGMVALVLDRPPRHFSLLSLLINTGALLTLFFVIYWLNQRAVRKSLEPRRARLQKMLSDLLQQP